MSVETHEAVLQAAYDIVEVLEGAVSEGPPAKAEEIVREKLPLVGVDELVSQLREAEAVTGSLMEMGSALSPATFCILDGAHVRAERALEAALALSRQA